MTPCPIRPIDFSERVDNTFHDKRVAFIECMLVLNRRKDAAECNGDRELVQCQIDSTNREIDELVHEL